MAMRGLGDAALGRGKRSSVCEKTGCSREQRHVQSSEKLTRLLLLRRGARQTPLAPATSILPTCWLHVLELFTTRPLHALHSVDLLWHAGWLLWVPW